MKTKCPKCGEQINAASLFGSIRSKKKAESSRRNGRKGGRPKRIKGGRPIDPASARQKRLREQEKAESRRKPPMVCEQCTGESDCACVRCNEEWKA